MKVRIKKKNLAKKATQNKTSDFILPLLGYPKSFYKPFLFNAYIGDIDIKGYEDSRLVYILFKFSGKLEYADKEKALESHPNFQFSYSLFDGQYTMYVIELPKMFYKDYSMFLQGKYSEFSSGAQLLILKDRNNHSSMPKVFKKHKDLKIFWERKLACELGQQEVWPIMNARDEIFNKELFEGELHKKIRVTETEES